MHDNAVKYSMQNLVLITLNVMLCIQRIFDKYCIFFQFYLCRKKQKCVDKLNLRQGNGHLSICIPLRKSKWAIEQVFTVWGLLLFASGCFLNPLWQSFLNHWPWDQENQVRSLFLYIFSRSFAQSIDTSGSISRQLAFSERVSISSLRDFPTTSFK